MTCWRGQGPLKSIALDFWRRNHITKIGRGVHVHQIKTIVPRWPGMAKKGSAPLKVMNHARLGAQTTHWPACTHLGGHSDLTELVSKQLSVVVPHTHKFKQECTWMHSTLFLGGVQYSGRPSNPRASMPEMIEGSKEHTNSGGPDSGITTSSTRGGYPFLSLSLSLSLFQRVSSHSKRKTCNMWHSVHAHWWHRISFKSPTSLSVKECWDKPRSE